MPALAVTPVRWFVARHRQKQGPFTLGQLKQLVALGQLQPCDMLLLQGAQKWSPAGEILGLFPGTSTVTPLLIPQTVPLENLSTPPPIALSPGAAVALPPASVAKPTEAPPPKPPRPVSPGGHYLPQEGLWLVAGFFGLLALVIVLVNNHNGDPPLGDNADSANATARAIMRRSIPSTYSLLESSAEKQADGTWIVSGSKGIKMGQDVALREWWTVRLKFVNGKWQERAK